MPVELTPDQDRRSLRTALGHTVDRAAVRTGEPRRQRLQKNLRRLSRAWETTVSIDTSIETTDLDAEGDPPDRTFDVTITGRRVSQPVTDYEPRAWDWLVQRALAAHEAGHIRYTNFRDWNERIEALDPGDRGVAHTLHNTLEDAAVETQIAVRWPNYAAPLRALRANLLEETTLGIPDPERGGFLYPMAHAVHAAVLEYWLEDVYGLDLGILDSLVDPADPTHHFAPAVTDRSLFEQRILPRTRRAVAEVRATPDAVERNAVIAAFVEAVLDYLDTTEADGRSQKQGQAGEGQTAEGMPDDSRSNESGAETAPADALSDPDQGELAPDESAPGGSALSADDSLAAEAELQAQALEEAADDATAEAGLRDAYLDELERLSETIDADGTQAADGLRTTSLLVPTESWAADPELFARVQRESDRLARIFRNRLQHERRSAIRHGTRRGRLDPQRLHRTGLEPKPSHLKRARVDPEAKEYHMAFVLDRSASMGRKIRQAEYALGLLLFALEAVDVATMVIELYDSTVRLAKPFGVPVETQADRLFHGRTAGATPLSDAFQLVHTRLQRGAPSDSKSVLFVLTDDQPANPDTFAATIEATTIPVIGVNLATEPSTGTYTRSVAAEPGADLRDQLERLATEVLL